MKPWPQSDSRRLVVVSNRLPVSIDYDDRGISVKQSAGGLVTALAPVLRGSHGLWIGWPGVDGADEDLAAAINASDAVDGFEVAAVSLTERDVDEFYEGFANRVIWPLFHDQFTLCSFEPAYWDAYKRVNRKFAEVVARELREDDVVWIHDYHLMCLGAELRRGGVSNPLGFFNHIPFPTVDILSRLPWAKEILDDLAAFDLVGFQNAADERHFDENLRYLSTPGEEADRATAESSSARGRAGSPNGPVPTRTGVFPISIDYHEFRDLAASAGVQRRVECLERDMGKRTVILGVDRLDYSKGLPHKLAAFRYALEQNPELRGRITLVQYVVPSRQHVPEYAELQRQLEGMVGAINGELSEPGWIPIHYHFDSLDREELCAWYRFADVCFVTSLKDGMNLIAKEYVSCQVGDPGVLVLSKFAGAAEEFAGSALVINPYDVEQSADALRIACGMTLEERRARIDRLSARVRDNDVFRWVGNYLEALDAAAAREDDRARRDNVPAAASGLAAGVSSAGGSKRLPRGGVNS